MRKIKTISILVILCLIVSIICPLAMNKAQADGTNEVTLNFGEATIENGKVIYPEVGEIELYKATDTDAGSERIDITNNMKIDLNEYQYSLKITELTPTGDSASSVAPLPVKLVINKKYYSIKKSPIFELDTTKFKETLNIELKRTGTIVNTIVEKVYTDTTASGAIDLSNGKEYTIDFNANDEFTKGLKTFADLEETVYYKNENNQLVKTENGSEAVIKIVGNKDENKAIISALNIGNKTEENYQGTNTKYTGSNIQYDETTYEDDSSDIINETRTDYYDRCKYNLTIKYANAEIIPDQPTEQPTEEPSNEQPKEDEKNTEVKEETSNTANPKTGDNIIAYIAMFVVSIAGIIVTINKKK